MPLRCRRKDRRPGRKTRCGASTARSICRRKRFGHFELTDQQAGETLDRIPAVAGEIRLADRAYLQPDRMATLLEAGADIVIRAGWKSARWLDAEGDMFDLVAEDRKSVVEGKRVEDGAWRVRR